MWAGTALVSCTQLCRSGLFLVPLVLLAVSAVGQVRIGLGNDPIARSDTFSVASAQPFQLDDAALLSTVTVHVRGAKLSADRIRLAPNPPRVWIDLAPQTLQQADPAQVIVHYRVIPISREKRQAVNNVLLPVDTDSTTFFTPVQQTETPNGPNDIFGNTNLRRSGSISRGVIAGNRRDATIESGLRLQLAGEVVDGVNLRAVLSDENTPIVPEGTTQRINEFDKVFIEIAAPKVTAQLGDFELQLDKTELARLSRKLQGVNTFGALPGVSAAGFTGGSAVLSGATSRGIFRSQNVSIEDGVQGPYRLQGLRGERFIILIPGSEVVYLDGRQLTRGESNDYVMDYATAEITFTANNLMATDRRVIIEFQYTTNQFTRTLLASEVQTGFWNNRDGSPRATLGVTFIRESDSKQFFDEFGLTSADSLLLAQSGDLDASRSGAERVDYDPEAIFVQYLKEVRTLPSGLVDTVFAAIDGLIDDSTEVFAVQFSPVGEGMGRYVRVGRNINGIVYEYVGSGLGEYEPVRLLPKPKQQRLLDLNGSLSLHPSLSVYGEWAQSDNDKNRFSSLDADDDVDNAHIMGVRFIPTRIGDIASGPIVVSGTFERRFRGTDFETFNRARPVEFARKWNLSSQNLSVNSSFLDGSETINQGDLSINVGNLGKIGADYGKISLGDAFAATRLAGRFERHDSTNMTFRYNFELIDSVDDIASLSGDWLRQLAVAEARFNGGRFIPRLEFEHEDRRQRDTASDSLVTGSELFVELRPGIGFVGSKIEAAVEFEYRADNEALAGNLERASGAYTVQSRFKYRPKSGFRTDGTVGYRVRDFEDQFKSTFGRENQESLVLAWTGDWRPLRKAVAMSWLYDAQTQRTPRLQEIYVRTGPDLGEYIWIDDNGDGVLQIEEFVRETTPNEGEYVKSFVPSDSLFAIVSVRARIRLDLDPGKILSKSKTRIGKALSNMSTGTVLEVLEKSRDPKLSHIYLLRQQYFRRDNTLNGRLLFRQNVSLFKRTNKYGLDGTYSSVRGLSDLAASAEDRVNRVSSIEGRVRPSPKWSSTLRVSRDRNLVNNTEFATRQFDLRSVGIEPGISFLPKQYLTLKASLSFKDKEDRLQDRSARLVRVPLEVRVQRARRFQITGRWEIASIALSGEASGLAQFELTDGRGAGTSYLWNLNGEYTLSRYLRATVSYDGRAPSAAPVLHTVRMQLSAIF